LILLAIPWAWLHRTQKSTSQVGAIIISYSPWGTLGDPQSYGDPGHGAANASNRGIAIKVADQP
jgi:hypothetical protein